MSPGKIAIDSEIGRLRRVIVHTPGAEMENMTPADAPESLYDDILNLDLALREHSLLAGVLGRVAEVLQLKDLLAETFEVPAAREEVVLAMCRLFGCPELVDELLSIPPRELAGQLIEGTPMRKDTLAKYLSPSGFSFPPLPNAFFPRDATMCVHDRVIIGSMAKRARTAESLLFRTVFRHHPWFAGTAFYLDGIQPNSPGLTIEGGDLLVLRRDLVAIGYSERTSPSGIDELLRRMSGDGPLKEAIVLTLPHTRATIHLDMIFTMVDEDLCVVSPPFVTGPSKCRAIRLTCDRGRITRIREYAGLLEALEAVSLSLEPVPCGGSNPLRQEREQWSSGANFFAFAPGRILGYGQNTETLAELARRGFEIVAAEDVIEDRVDPASLSEDGRRMAVTMEGAELARGGGGSRCMTLPVARD